MTSENISASSVETLARTRTADRASGSYRAWTGVLTAAAMLSFGAGCIVVDDDGDDDVIIVDDNPPAPVIESVPIDQGEGLSQEPGEGAGVFVEYLGDGNWSIWTTCDSEFSGVACLYDIFATAPDIRATGEDDLEGLDVIFEDFDTLQLQADTTNDFDGMVFAAAPGEPVQIEVWLDGALDGRLVFWVAEGTVLQGLPTNPTLFVP
jgi:hypothetical protein